MVQKHVVISVVPMMLLLSVASFISASSSFVDFFKGGVDTSRWDFKRNGTCWRMGPDGEAIGGAQRGVTYCDSNNVHARDPAGITIALEPYHARCPNGGGNATAVGSQIATKACLGQGTYDIHMRPPHGASEGALAFFSPYSAQSGRIIQFNFGYDVATPIKALISVNGRTGNNVSFNQALLCTMPSTFNTSSIHKYTIHWSNGDEFLFAIDGVAVAHIKEPLILDTLPCAYPYVILRSNGKPLPSTAFLDVHEVAFTAGAASRHIFNALKEQLPRGGGGSSSSSAIECKQQK